MKKTRLFLVVVASAMVSMTSFAGEWTDDNRCYLKDNGSYASNEWIDIDGKWYWFSEGVDGKGYLPGLAGRTKDGSLYNANGEYIDMNIDGAKYATEELYNQLQEGMSYDQVVSILGKEHEVTNTERRQHGNQTFDYLQVKWYSQDLNSNIRATFKNGILSARHATWR